MILGIENIPIIRNIINYYINKIIEEQEKIANIIIIENCYNDKQLKEAKDFCEKYNIDYYDYLCSGCKVNTLLICKRNI